MMKGSRRSERFVVTTIAMLGLGLLANGCGGDEEAPTKAPSMLEGSSARSEDSDGSNRVPEVKAVTIRPSRPAPGRVVHAQANVIDVDGDATSVTYQWRTPDGRVLGEGREFDTSGLPQGASVEVVAVANDGLADSRPKSLSFRMAESTAEISLVAIDATEGTTPGSTLRAVVEATNEGSGRFEPDLEWRVNGATVGHDEALETERFHPGDVIVLRAHIESERGPTRRVSSEPVRLSRGSAPVIESEPIAGIEGGLFRYQVRARSPEPAASLEFELLTGPDGMRIDTKSGLVQWSPKPDQVGRFQIEIVVRDQWGSGSAQSFEIVADPAGIAPASPR